MRKARTVETQRCYHLMSRLAHRAFFLTEEERTRAVELMYRVAEFSGVLVLAYVFMLNHFHIFIYVPESEDIGEAELLRRINVLYRGMSLNVVSAEWERLKDEERKESVAGYDESGRISRFVRYKQAFLHRMWNSAEFMRTFKQHFTMSYNGRREHVGTMWEGRYHDRNHPPEEPVMWRTAAYVDANPVKAGMVSWPDSYAWCSFAAACRGDARARRGYAFMYGEADDWDVIREKHEISMREALVENNAGHVAEESVRKENSRREPVSKHDPQLPEPRAYNIKLDRGIPAIAERILDTLTQGPMSPAALRAAVGIKSRIHFSRYYIEPLLAQRLIARTDPAHPNSPQQKYVRII